MNSSSPEKPALDNTSEKSTGPLLAELTLLFTATSWGMNIVALKFAVTETNPWVFSAFRLTIAAAVLSLLAFLFRKKTSTPITFGTFLVPRVLIFSLLNGLGYHGWVILGITRTTAGNAALLMSSMPMWTAFLSFLFLKEKLSKWTWIGMGLAAVGTGLIVSQSLDLSLKSILGNVFVLCGAFCWAGSAVVSRPLLKKYSPLQLAMIAGLTTVPFHHCFGFLQVVFFEASVPTQWPVWMAALYSGTIATGIGYATWHYGVKILGASHASLYQNLVTLVAVVGGFFLLGEPIYAVQILGGAAIVAGLLLSRIGKKST